MSHLRAWFLRFAGLFGKEQKDRELAEELESHLQMHIEDNLRSGMDPQEARRQALLKFGGVESAKETYRRRRGMPWLESFFQDVHFGARMLRKSRGFTIVVTLTLALGIGATTAILSLVNGTLLSPLRLPKPDQVVQLWEILPGYDRAAISVPNFQSWQEQNHVFQGIAAYRFGDFNLRGADNPQRVFGAYVTANFFSVLGAPFASGRGFLPGEDTAGRNQVAVITSELSRSLFGADSNPVGQNILLNARTFTVVGLMPANFRLPAPAIQVWVPFVPGDDQKMSRGMHILSALGRLKDGVSRSEAQAEMSALMLQIARAYPKNVTDLGVLVRPLNQALTEDVRTSLFILLAAVGLVFLIVCANVVNLLLTRSAARAREIAIRTAVGASRWRLLRQFVVENLMLSMLGGVLGWFVAQWAVRAPFLTPQDVPGSQTVHADTHVLIYTFFLSLFVASILGVAMAVQSARRGVQTCLKEGSATTTAGRRHGQGQKAVVVAQIATSLLLVLGAVLLIESFSHLLEVSPGLQPEHALTMRIALPAAKYSIGHPENQFYESVIQKLQVMPQIQAAGVTSLLPIQQGSGTDSSFQIEGRPKPAPSQSPDAEFRAVSSRYFQAMGISLLQGRLFTSDDGAQSPAVLIINKALADKFFPGEDPVGKRLRGFGFGVKNIKDLTSDPEQEQWAPIVGVVGNTKQFGLARPAQPEIDTCYLQSSLLPPVYAEFFVRTMSLVVRAAGDPKAIVNSVRSAVSEVDPEQAIYNVKSMPEVISDSVADRRFETLLLTSFAAVALGLATLGIYGVMSYTVRARTNEIGIRVAVGAQRLSILNMIVSSGMKIALIGVCVGIAGAWALTRFLASRLYGVSPTDPLTFAGVTLLLLTVALLACYIPARRATKVDPIVALRHE